jgi:hypothetical protein
MKPQHLFPIENHTNNVFPNSKLICAQMSKYGVNWMYIVIPFQVRHLAIE